MEKSVDAIVQEIKNVDNNVNAIIVPVLKDTIADYKRTFQKMFIIIICQIIALFIIITYSSYLFSLSNARYSEFVDKYELQLKEESKNE